MDYQTFEPSFDLGAFIKCHWTLKVPKEFSNQKQQILPDGCFEICFVLGDDIKRYSGDGSFIIQPRSFVLGQIKKPYFINPVGEVDTFAVRFYPNGLHHFINVPIQELSNHETELSKVFDPIRADQLEKDIAQTEGTSKKISIMEKFLLDTLQQNVNANELVDSTIDIMLSTKGSLGVNDILGGNRSKRRQLERKFSSLVGLTPKQLCRIIRLQSTLKMMLDKNNADLTSVGHENEYYDQSHFIKDFKDFAGISPKEFYKEKTFALSSIIYSKH